MYQKITALNSPSSFEIIRLLLAHPKQSQEFIKIQKQLHNGGIIIASIENVYELKKQGLIKIRGNYFSLTRFSQRNLRLLGKIVDDSNSSSTKK